MPMELPKALRRRRRLAAAAALLAASCAGPSETSDQRVHRRESVIDLTNEEGRDFRVFVSAPGTPAPSRGYGVAYVLDGNRFHSTIASSAGPNTIVAAVGYPTSVPDEIARRRLQDFTTQTSPTGLSAEVMRLEPQFGGINEFMLFLTADLLPLIRGNGGVNRNCEALMGHSLGGLAVLHAAFAEPGQFDAYVAASPSIWWAERDVLRRESSFVEAMSATGPDVTLLLSAGGLEQTPPSNVDAAQRGRIQRNRMIGNAAELAARLQRASPRLTVLMDVFPGLTHDEASTPAFERGLAWVEACAS